MLISDCKSVDNGRGVFFFFAKIRLRQQFDMELADVDGEVGGVSQV